MTVTVLVFASFCSAAELSERFTKKIESAEEAFKNAVQKADNARFYAVQKAGQERVKVLKSALVEATKAGDFKVASEINAKLGYMSLSDAISGFGWDGSPVWGRFVFNRDHTMSYGVLKNVQGRWAVIDEDSVLILHHRDKENDFLVDRLSFNKDRTKVSSYSVGIQQTGAAWEAEKVVTKK